MANVMQSYINQLATLFKSAAELAKINNEVAHYRIIQLPNEKDPHVHIQVLNKQVILKILPEKLMRDDFLMGFNKSDIALITHIGTKKEIKLRGQSKFFKIIKQFFNRGGTSFVIEKEEGIVEEHPANEIYNNPSISEKLTGSDGIKVGYSVAEEHFQKIIKLKEKP